MQTVEILTIGREILDGRVIDTNAVWLAEKLKKRGLVARYGQRVDDDFDRVIEAFQIAQKRSQIILVTGGLGPTADDLTAEAFSRFLGEPLELNPKALSQVEGWFKRMNRPLLEVQKKQAYFPKSCEILENLEGTAPGFSRKFESGQSWYFMPGVPKEMKRMMEAHVLDQLPEVKGYRSSAWATQFTSEGELQKRLMPAHQALLPGFEISYRTRFPENHIGLHAVCLTAEQNEAYDKIARMIASLLDGDVFSGGIGKDLRSLETEVVELLARSNSVVSTVESCTGGLIANRITDVSGSSAVYWGSWITYDNAAKEALGVPASLLDRHGAVSSEVAQALSEAGVKKLHELTWQKRGELLDGVRSLCVSTTGIAGPLGGSDEKPVGLCYVSISELAADGVLKTQVEEVKARLFLQRIENKNYFAQKALELLRLRVLGGS